MWPLREVGEVSESSVGSAELSEELRSLLGGLQIYRPMSRLGVQHCSKTMPLAASASK